MSHHRHTPPHKVDSASQSAYTPPDLSETMVERAVVRVQQRSNTSRNIENGLALVGIAQAGLYGTLEALARSGFTLGACKPNSGIPWVTLAIFSGCVLPKTVGRASAGKAWSLFAGIAGKR